METLFIKPNYEQQSAEWVVIDATGNPQVAIRQGSLAAVKDFTQQRRVVCAVPSTDLYLDQVTLPAGSNRRKFRQAAPYALEEELAEDLEELHFALGKEQSVIIHTETGEDDTPSNKQLHIPVVAINKERLQNWLDMLAAAGIKPHALMPDVLTVPLTENQWTVFIGGKTALVRTDKNNGFACELENLSVLLNTALAQEPTPSRIQLWNYNEQTPELSLQQEIEVEVIEPNQEPLATLARGYQKETAINLLQGEFSYREEYGKLLKPWRIPLILLSVLITVLFSSNVIEYFRLKNENRQLTQQLEDTYKRAFPQARNIVKPRFQMEQKLKQLGGASSADSPFLEMLRIATEKINTNKKININSINFNGERLDIDLSVPDMQSLDTLKQQLDQQTGLSTEIQSASAEGSEVSGRLRITKL